MSYSAIIRRLDRIEKMLEISDMVNQVEAAALLGVPLRTFQNKQYQGKFEGMYTINAAGKRSYYKSRLLNIK